MLVGAGHAHLEVIRRLGQQPSRHRVICVSPENKTPYSGMLPGWIHGRYTADEVHVDVRRLCRESGIELIVETLSGTDLNTRRAHLSSGSDLAFDLLSLNTGGTQKSLPGENSLPNSGVKPVSNLVEFLKTIGQTPSPKPPTVVVEAPEVQASKWPSPSRFDTAHNRKNPGTSPSSLPN